MKPLTKKMLKSGIIDRHMANLFERWGQLEEGASDLVGKEKVTKQTFEEFAEELEGLIEDTLEVKETRLEIDVKGPRQVWFFEGGASFEAFEDAMSRLLVDRNQSVPKRGDKVHKRYEKIVWTVIDVEPIFQNEKLAAYQITLGY